MTKVGDGGVTRIIAFLQSDAGRDDNEIEH